MVRETTDPGPGRSALSGAVWASLFGLILGGPVGWVVGGAVGAGTGAVAAKIIDHGVSDEWVAWFRESVAPGTTILALLVEGLDPAALVAELERFAGARLAQGPHPRAGRAGREGDRVIRTSRPPTAADAG